MSALISDADVFETSFAVYLDALKLLASSPEKQCEIGSNYNVAWELCQDISAGNYLFNNPEASFTEEQIESIASLSSAILEIPDDVTAQAIGYEPNLVAMSQPCWEGLRLKASALLSELSDAT